MAFRSRVTVRQLQDGTQILQNACRKVLRLIRMLGNVIKYFNYLGGEFIKHNVSRTTLCNRPTLCVYVIKIVTMH